MTWHSDIPEHYRNQIVTGDARALAERLPDTSVDFVFADPIYENLDDYRWLAKTAARVLKPGKACLVWCSSVKQYDVQPIMRQHLTFVLQLTYTKIAKTYKVWGYKTFLWTTPCLWFQRDGDHFHEDHDWLIDTVLDHRNAIISTDTPPAKTYKWHKNPEAYAYWLLRFTKPGDLVYDPFAGSGSLPIECVRYGRNFIASEIQPDVAEAARQRLAVVQPIAPEFLETQTEFAL
jgi:site-specific DNA-methyltransferase (adenine-specific)